MASKDTQSRKYQLTINNPADKGLDHDAIKKALEQLTACSYYCKADEIGTETQTPHTHVFVYLRNSTRFSRIKNLFPEAHIEAAHGTVQENREYVSKSGKWAKDKKADTSVPDTFEEWGEIPEEPGQGARSDIAELYSKIKAGTFITLPVKFPSAKRKRRSFHCAVSLEFAMLLYWTAPYRRRPSATGLRSEGYLQKQRHTAENHSAGDVEIPPQTVPHIAGGPLCAPVDLRHQILPLHDPEPGGRAQSGADGDDIDGDNVHPGAPLEDGFHIHPDAQADDAQDRQHPAAV